MSEFADKLIELFEDYSEYFGLSDKDFPELKPQKHQCDFEDKFNELICEHKGHNVGPDNCGKPEHDYCYRCHKLKTEIAQK